MFNQHIETPADLLFAKDKEQLEIRKKIEDAVIKDAEAKKARQTKATERKAK